MKNLVMYRESEDSWCRYIKKRVRNNKNFLGLLQAETGAGKSWSAISIAYSLDKEFSVKQIAFSVLGIMEIIDSDWFKKKKLKIIIFDEAQTDAGRREWRAVTNKLLNLLLSTFRHQNIILLFTTPYSDFLDSNSMKLIHGIFDVKGVNMKTNKCLLKPKLLQYNVRMKKFYEHCLYVNKNGKVHKLVDWYVNKPPAHLIEPYEEKKTQFTTNLNKKILNELKQLENEDIVDNNKDRVELNPDSMQPLIWEVVQDGYDTQEGIRKAMSEKLNREVKCAQLSTNIMSMRRKGWDIRQYKRRNKRLTM